MRLCLKARRFLRHLDHRPGPAAASSPLRGQRGFMLIEGVLVTTLMLVVTGATMTVLEVATRAQSRDQNYAQEISTTQTALARLVHDLRQATSFSVLTPNAIEFQMVVNGTSYNVKYDCTAPDSLGSAYQRCARTSAPTSTQLPSYGATAGVLDIQHVANGNVSTYCNQTGTAQSGSVFFISNPTIVNSDASGLLCDEAYENIIGAQFFEPTYVQVLAKIPSSGELTKGGLSHQTVLQSGAFIPNLDPGA